RISQVREQADRSRDCLVGCAHDTRPYGFLQLQMRWAQIVTTPEFGQVASVNRPECSVLEDRLDLIEIQPQLRDPITEGVRARSPATMPNDSFVHCTMPVHRTMPLRYARGRHIPAHAARILQGTDCSASTADGSPCTPNARAIATALRIPSS